MKKHYDVAIIGGGIIGNSVAYHLAKEKLNVAVFEAGKIGGKATSAAAGMLGAHSECDDLDVFFPFARASQQAHRQLEKELKDRSGIDIKMQAGGIYKLAYSAAEKDELAPILSLPTVEWLEAEKVFEQEPSLNHDIFGAAFIRDDVHVRPYLVCQAFSEAAKSLGAAIFESTPVQDIHKNGASHQIITSSGSFEAEYVVVANGVWATDFFQKLDLEQRIVPVKGECLSVRNENSGLRHTLFHNHFYIVPRGRNQLVIGATMIENDWTETPTLKGIEQLITKAKSMLPEVTDMKVDSFWAGLRPQTFDQKPFIGPHPEQQKIIFATGHYRNGILLAPATGEMVRDLILGRKIKKEWTHAFKVDREAALV